MGTVHLTLRESMHEKLRRYAAEMGVSVTDLIKMFIQEGLKRIEAELAKREAERSREVNEMLMELMKKIEDLERTITYEIVALEGDIYRMQRMINSLRKRVARLEDMVEERLIPTPEPELVDHAPETAQ